MLRRTMQIGDELHVGEQVVIVEKISKTGQIHFVVMPKTEPYVLRRSRRAARVEQTGNLETPYHPDVETMLQG